MVHAGEKYDSPPPMEVSIIYETTYNELRAIIELLSTLCSHFMVVANDQAGVSQPKVNFYYCHT